MVGETGDEMARLFPVGWEYIFLDGGVPQVDVTTMGDDVLQKGMLLHGERG